MKRILIVDDEKNVSISLSIGLKRQGFDVETALNGQEALLKMREAIFDCLLTDVRMPKVNGIELTRITNQIYPSIHIILMSAYDFNEIVEQNEDLNKFPKLSKPFDILEVVNLINRQHSDEEEIGYKSVRTRGYA
ncbi:MAG: response regulator [Candidatus Lokiarchaeota archaeon]|nr:response regulator [Candidatus Lokiarchaeota archaeon]